MSTNNNFPVCILTSGTGSRLLPLTKNINKSLIPLGAKPAIGYILDNISVDQKVIIAIGHKGDIVKEFLLTFYSQYDFTFINVDDYLSPNAGPAYSLSKCHDFLQEPFYFISCDTIWDQKLKDLPTDMNWLGTSSKYSTEKKVYCNCILKNDNIIQFYNKQDPNSSSVAFTGLAFIKDYSVFWKNLNISLTQGYNDIFHGFIELSKLNLLYSVDINWKDVGNFESINDFLGNSFDFSKTDEFIWIANNYVIKMFKSEDTLKAKFEKSKIIENVVPQTSCTKHFLYYPYIPAKTFYNGYSNNLFLKLLNFLEKHLWTDIKKIQDQDIFLNEFYIEKTKLRLDLFFNKYPDYKPSTINGHKFKHFTNDLLKDITLFMATNSVFTSFHGDLQFDNILIDDSNEFTLIDWRESFGSNTTQGDIYYDFAKLYGGIILNYFLIKQNRFNYQETNNEILFSFEKSEWQSEAKKTFENYVIMAGYNLEFVKNLTALIFLNMAPLHHYPFDKLLYCLSFTQYKGYHDN